MCFLREISRFAMARVFLFVCCMSVFVDRGGTREFLFLLSFMGHFTFPLRNGRPSSSSPFSSGRLDRAMGMKRRAKRKEREVGVLATTPLKRGADILVKKLRQFHLGHIGKSQVGHIGKK